MVQLTFASNDIEQRSCEMTPLEPTKQAMQL